DVHGARWVGAVDGKVAGNRDEVGLLLGDRLPNRLERDGVAVDVGQHDDTCHRRTPSPGMMKLRVASQAVSPSTLATPRPRPKRPPSLSITTSRPSVAPGATTRLKRHSSMPAKSPIRSPKPGCFAT